jgi:hypothetical protein
MPEDHLWGEALTVEEASGQRWEAALSILAGGGYIVWRGIGLTFRTQTVGEQPKIGSKLWVRVGTAWDPQNMTRERAEAELRTAQVSIAELARESKDFAGLISGHAIAYELLYDYGMGAIRLATWTDEGFAYQWK